MEKDFIFICKKCQHNLYVSSPKVHGLWDYDCPNCGEEGYENWILSGEGTLED